MAKEIVLKATEGAPEVIAQGVHDVTLENGHYLTNHRAFADSIIGKGYATEVEPEDETKAESEATESDKGEQQ